MQFHSNDFDNPGDEDVSTTTTAAPTDDVLGWIRVLMALVTAGGHPVHPRPENWQLIFSEMKLSTPP